MKYWEKLKDHLEKEIDDGSKKLDYCPLLSKDYDIGYYDALIDTLKKMKEFEEQ